MKLQCDWRLIRAGVGMGSDVFRVSVGMGSDVFRVGVGMGSDVFRVGVGMEADVFRVGVGMEADVFRIGVGMEADVFRVGVGVEADVFRVGVGVEADVFRVGVGVEADVFRVGVGMEADVFWEVSQQTAHDSLVADDQHVLLALKFHDDWFQPLDQVSDVLLLDEVAQTPGELRQDTTEKHNFLDQAYKPSRRGTCDLPYKHNHPVDGAGRDVDVHEVVHNAALDVVQNPVHQVPPAHVHDFDIVTAPVYSRKNCDRTCPLRQRFSPCRPAPAHHDFLLKRENKEIVEGSLKDTQPPWSSDYSTGLQIQNPERQDIAQLIQLGPE
ncbi:hypothetical protein JZ751_014725 [Albula glossodonta]|uniref:Uncharacterized protein n=1 Tax=Albula glossodonta TaxID=121402 RepID=A0A8T2N805_9TELE|nr:hypothetical protein JZ751_014725 [Albula glossodonta]